MGEQLAPRLVDPVDTLSSMTIRQPVSSSWPMFVHHRQSWDVVNPSQGMMFPILAGEDDGTTALDLHHRAISKAPHTVDASIKLGEGRSCAGHVVHRSGIEDH